MSDPARWVEQNLDQPVSFGRGRRSWLRAKMATKSAHATPCSSYEVGTEAWESAPRVGRQLAHLSKGKKPAAVKGKAQARRQVIIPGILPG